MEKLSSDILRLIPLAIELDLPSLLSYCLVSKEINRAVCKNPDFWRMKLAKDFPDAKYDINDDPKLVYRMFYERINRLIKHDPELKDILPLIDINKIKPMNFSRDEREYFEKITRYLLNILNDEVLIKIMNDYNKHKIYGRDKKVLLPTGKNIENFMNDIGMVYRDEYKHYYKYLVKELKYYLNHPNYTFDPYLWDEAYPDF